MGHIAIPATEPATGAASEIYARATQSGNALASQPSPSPIGPTPKNAVIETILRRSAAKYYDPAATLSDDQISARTEEHTYELQSLMTTSYDAFYLTKKQKKPNPTRYTP